MLDAPARHLPPVALHQEGPRPACGIEHARRGGHRVGIVELVEHEVHQRERRVERPCLAAGRGLVGALLPLAVRLFPIFVEASEELLVHDRERLDGDVREVVGAESKMPLPARGIIAEKGRRHRAHMPVVRPLRPRPRHGEHRPVHLPVDRLHQAPKPANRRVTTDGLRLLRSERLDALSVEDPPVEKVADVEKATDERVRRARRELISEKLLAQVAQAPQKTRVDPLLAREHFGTAMPGNPRVDVFRAQVIEHLTHLVERERRVQDPTLRVRHTLRRIAKARAHPHCRRQRHEDERRDVLVPDAAVDLVGRSDGGRVDHVRGVRQGAFFAQRVDAPQIAAVVSARLDGPRGVVVAHDERAQTIPGDPARRLRVPEGVAERRGVHGVLAAHGSPTLRPSSTRILFRRRDRRARLRVVEEGTLDDIQRALPVDRFDVVRLTGHGIWYFQLDEEPMGRLGLR
jgi:hypothetical protein